MKSYLTERTISECSSGDKINPCSFAAVLSANESSVRCPITNHPCEGDLCEDYGCARKGGLLPYSHDNFK